jgi:hypothetical protein
MTRSPASVRNQMRTRIAHLAARLMAEDGIQDFAFAKRKAAKQLGAEDTKNLPNNAEIEEALRSYQAIYQGGEQPVRIEAMRRQAIAVMHLLQAFNPHLTGSVLAGTAARHSDINLLLFADSDKDVEIFLLNRDIPFQRTEKRFRFADAYRTVPVLLLRYGGEADVDVAIFSSDDIRACPRSPVDGRALARARVAEVEALLGVR